MKGKCLICGKSPLICSHHLKSEAVFMLCKAVKGKEEKEEKE